MSAKLIKQLQQQRQDLLLLAAALEDVQSLMGESKGVDGYHLNGDCATWDELRAGYLDKWDAALEVAKRVQQPIEIPIDV